MLINTIRLVKGDFGCTPPSLPTAAVKFSTKSAKTKTQEPRSYWIIYSRLGRLFITQPSRQRDRSLRTGFSGTVFRAHHVPCLSLITPINTRTILTTACDHHAAAKRLYLR
jgi:hypothetical protein